MASKHEILFWTIGSQETVFFNVSFKSNYFDNSAVLKTDANLLFLQLCNIFNNIFRENSCFLNSSSHVIIKESNFKNNSFERNFWLHNSVNFNVNLIFKTSCFENNSAGVFADIEMNLLNGSLSFFNSTFETNTFKSNLLNGQDINFINFTLVYFKENLSPNLISLFQVHLLIFDNFHCLKNNFQTQKSINLMIYGSCIYVTNFHHFIFKHSKIIDCFSNANPTGLTLLNQLFFDGKIYITTSIFANNVYNSSFSFIHAGTAMFLSEISLVLIQKCCFHNNSINLEYVSSGGPAIVFSSESESGSLLLDSSEFVKNSALRGSLTIEFTGFHLAIQNCHFSKLQQLTGSFLSKTAVILMGTLKIVTITNCTMINNQAVFGLFFLKDKNLTLVMLDGIILIDNFGVFTPGIYAVSETINKIIIWRNSFVLFHNFTHNVLLMYLYLTTTIVQFKVYFFNNTITHNVFPPDNVAFRNIINIWGYSNNASMLFQKNKILKNTNLWVIFSFFGIQPLLKIFITDCIISNNQHFVLIAADHASIFCWKTVFEGNDLTHGYLVWSLTITLYLMDVYMFNHGAATNIINLGNEGQFFCKNLTIAGFFDKGMDAIIFDSLARVFIDKLYLQNGTCKSVFKLLNTKNILMKFVGFFRINSLEGAHLENSNVQNAQSFFLFENQIMVDIFLKKYSIFNLSLILKTFNCSYCSVLTAEDSSFYIFKAVLNYTMKCFHKSQFQLIDSNLSMTFLKICSFNSKYPLIVLDKGALFLKNISILDSTSFISTLKGKIEIKNCVFANSFDKNFDKKENYTFVPNPFTFNKSVMILIKNSHFENISGRKSPISFVDSYEGKMFLIVTSTFKSMVSNTTNGGALSFFNIKLQITNCSFISNSAKLSGGAFYLYCDLNLAYFCIYKITNNVFLDNFAMVAGGAYKWEYVKPIEYENLFLNNSANNSDNVSSFYCKLGFELHEMNIFGDIIVSFLSFGQNSSDTLEINNFTGFSHRFYIKFYPLDSYNQIIYEDIRDSMNLNLINSNFDPNINCFPKLTGRTMVLLNLTDNSFTFNEVNLHACPNATLFLNFSFKFPHFSSEAYLNQNSLNEKYEYYSILIKLITRFCPIGEIFDSETLSCDRCKENYYSLNNMDSLCNPCPPNAYCPGGKVIEVYENFWKMNDSANIYECDPNLENCLGGEYSLCSNDYTGILCLECKEHMQKDYMGICNECPIFFINIVANLGSYIIFITFLSFLILKYKQTNFTEKKQLSKILINYVHFVFITQRFHQDAYQSSLEMYVLLKMTFWISFDCLFNTFVPGRNFIIRNVMKLALFYLSFALFIIFAMFKKKTVNLKLIMMFYYTIYPFILTISFNNLVCRNVENSYILNNTTMVDCSSTEYTIFLAFFSVPNIVFISVVIPLVYTFHKYKNAKRKLIISKKTKFEGDYFIIEFFSKKGGKNLREFFTFLEKVLLIFCQGYILEPIIKLLSLFFVLFFFFLLQIQIYHVYQPPKAFAFYLSKTIILINIYFFVVLFLNYNHILAYGAILVAILLKIRFFLLFLIFLKKEWKSSNISMHFKKELKKPKPMHFSHSARNIGNNRNFETNV